MYSYSLLGYFYYMYDVTALFLPFLSVIVFPRHINIYIYLAIVGFMLHFKCLKSKKKKMLLQSYQLYGEREQGKGAMTISKVWSGFASFVVKGEFIPLKQPRKWE